MHTVSSSTSYVPATFRCSEHSVFSPKYVSGRALSHQNIFGFDVWNDKQLICYQLFSTPKLQAFKLDAVEPEKWQAWVDEQMSQAETVKPGSNVHITLGLNGTVYRSAVGAPNWVKICQELEPLDSTKTKLTQV